MIYYKYIYIPIMMVTFCKFFNCNPVTMSTTTNLFNDHKNGSRLCWGISGRYWDNSEENGNYHSILGLYRGDGKQTVRERTLTYFGSGMDALVIGCARTGT